MGRNIVAIAMKFEIVRARQLRDELLVRVRLRPAQLVIEMNDGKDNPQFVPQLEQQAQERNRINPARNGHTDAVSGPQQLLPPDVGEHALCEGMHGNMLAQRVFGQPSRLSGRANLGCSKGKSAPAVQRLLLTSFLILESVDEPLWLDRHDVQAGSDGTVFLRKLSAV